MSFSQALSGLNAQSQKLGAIGNNIANSQTVGFKSSNVQFADVFANSRVGLGTRVSAVLQNFNEGNIESTSRNLDLAVAGEGFFRFMDTSGQVVYSRNGQLTMTPEGELINAQGFQIMGYGVNAQGEVQVGGQPIPLTVDSDELGASATTGAGTVLNLDSRYTDNDLSSVELSSGEEIDYHYSNNFTVYDSLGNPRNISVYYEKVLERQNSVDTTTGNIQAGWLEFTHSGGDTYYQDPATGNYFDENGAGVTPDPDELTPVMVSVSNEWTAKVVMDGYYKPENDFALTFNQNGTLQSPAAGAMPSISFTTAELGGDPRDLEFTLNLAGSTQFGNDSTVSSLTQNGYTSGALVGITIDENGVVMRNYSNEQSRPAGQIALAHFRNPEGLTPAGDNVWYASAQSGQELVGAPGTGMLGAIVAGAVETSNVDMAGELVNMIIAQRAYQANSQTIKTQDEILQTAINLR